MERRDLLKAGLGLGATLVLERLTAPEAGAATKTATFYDGAADGPASPLSAIFFGIKGRRARGWVCSPNRSHAFRFEGSCKGNRLSMGVFAPNDPRATTRLGELTAEIANNQLSGSYQFGGDSANFTANLVTPDAAAMTEALGKYAARVYDEKRQVVFAAQLVLAKNGTYKLTRLLGEPGLPASLGGSWTFGSQGGVVYICPLFFRYATHLICHEDEFCCPPVICIPFRKDEKKFDLLADHPFNTLLAKAIRLT